MLFVRNKTGSTIHVRGDDGLPVCRAGKDPAKYELVADGCGYICSNCRYHVVDPAVRQAKMKELNAIRFEAAMKIKQQSKV